ncbi:YusW family protein [Bacillus infantis]|jgi:YusW-like protein|uniref:YusW family protein n=1 Tax=Bacillus infantis TaxID=324767 RepID=UPI00215579EC|nr:YusW family protein [Bacillus infantis]MCR6610982.1 YusW family protein [Bacillus infantis]
MKKSKLLNPLAAALLMLPLAACGNDEDEVQDPPPSAPSQEDDLNTDNKQPVEDFSRINFTDFELDAEYPDMKSYEVDYEYDRNNTMEAEIKDGINDEEFNGDEALDKLLEAFKQFTFDEESSEDEVLIQVIQGLDLNEDYENIEVEVTFTDGTEKTYSK